MNYMKKVADMLRVEMGEEFEIEGYGDSKFKITKEGLYNSNGHHDVSLFHGILTGNVKIKHRPWKPRQGQKYFHYDWCSDESEWLLIEETFEGDPYDLNNFAMGNCFETRDDAEAHTKDVIARYEAILDALRNRER